MNHHPTSPDPWADHPIVGEAVHQLGVFGGEHLDRNTAAHLLGSWIHNSELTDAERGAVLHLFGPELDSGWVSGTSGRIAHPGHPTWCSPEHCEVRDDNGFGRRHRSHPVTIEPPSKHDTHLSVWLSQDGYEPPDVATVLAMLRFTDYNSSTPGEVERLDTQWCEMPVARRLAETIAELVSTVGEPITDK